MTVRETDEMQARADANLKTSEMCGLVHPDRFSTCGRRRGHLGEHLNYGDGFRWPAVYHQWTDGFGYFRVHEGPLHGCQQCIREDAAASSMALPANREAAIKKLEYELDSAVEHIGRDLVAEHFGGAYGCQQCSYKCASEDAMATHTRQAHPMPGCLANEHVNGCGCLATTGVAGPACDPDCAKRAQENARPALIAGPIPTRCACCHVKGPLRSALDGWAGFEFPIITKAEQPGDDSESFICPKCAEKVAKFIAHLSMPMLDGEDLL